MYVFFKKGKAHVLNFMEYIPVGGRQGEETIRERSWADSAVSLQWQPHVFITILQVQLSD